MEIVLGVLGWLAGTAVFALSVERLSRANPEDRIPQWFGQPPNNPGTAITLRVFGVALLMISSTGPLGSHLGYWAAAAVIAGAVPAISLAWRHNDRVDRLP